MANCPKCAYRLKLLDHKPECPSCGVNLMYYKMEERLAADADKAEAEHIKMQPKVDRLKAASIGSPYSIIRLILVFVPLGMLFLPLVHVSAQVPFSPINTDVSILTLVSDVLGDLNFDVLTKMFSSDIVGSAFILYSVSIIFVLLTAVICVLNLVFVAMSASVNNRGIKRNIVLSSLGIIFMIVSILSFSIMNSKFSSLFEGIYSGKLSFGPFLVILGFLLLIGINALFIIKGIKVKYTDVSEYLERIGISAPAKAEAAAEKEEVKEEAAVTAE
jgi:magnesium-transporting ATPase (P-type)